MKKCANFSETMRVNGQSLWGNVPIRQRTGQVMDNAFISGFTPYVNVHHLHHVPPHSKIIDSHAMKYTQIQTKYIVSFFARGGEIGFVVLENGELLRYGVKTI